MIGESMQATRRYFCILIAMLLVFGLGFLCRAFAAEAVSDDNALKSKSFTLAPVQIDRLYEPNKGPLSTQAVNLGDKSDGGYLWVKDVSLKITDTQGNTILPRYLCHSRVQFVSPENDAPLTLSQGMLDLELPEGYAIRVKNTPEDVLLLAQTMNDDASTKKTLIYTFSIHYYSDAYAQAHRIKPLRQLQLYVNANDAVDSSTHQQSKGNKPLCASGSMCGSGPMFYVPPGRHTYSSIISSDKLSDFTVHFIKLHLHTYGESLSLVDDTTHKILWKGLGTTDANGTMVTKTDHYSSLTGFHIDPSHTYRLETVYNNTSNHLTDAMAIVRLYFEDNTQSASKNINSEMVGDRRLELRTR